LYFSLSSMWSSSRVMGLFLFLYIWNLFDFLCTSYIKWMYCSCWMVVLLSINYLNFVTDDEIVFYILFSQHISIPQIQCIKLPSTWCCTSWEARLYFMAWFHESVQEKF
jgi:hypothetical protein